MMSLLARLAREQDRTLVMVTHSPEASAHADRVLRLSHGQLVPER
jgi:putative ABC transport system ATP-binding protein